MRGFLYQVIASAPSSPLAADAETPAWLLTRDAEAVVRSLAEACGDAFDIVGETAIHRTAVIEPGATLKGPCVIGAGCFVAASALLRGGCWLDENSIIGPGCELKSTFIFAGSRLAHLNFVGDSVIGADVNIEAGAVIANYRNERSDKRIVIRAPDGDIDTGVDKFGALVGDGSRIGANAVIAPGAILAPRSIIPRLGLVDQG
jgi:UDP-N-acetylglucosamine diphosphorylase / glucose-1-phosphate thymidylyltransferase / UDP-N-acetylgalactosamine diphosphorylase / glucosamine-1-phosphate N-acetyltransferase / galactosamine-1-phosphate N-acetyltransferase